MTRAEHLDWAKKRALAHARRGELLRAVASIDSDFSLHFELINHKGVALGLLLWMNGGLESSGAVERWIEQLN